MHAALKTTTHTCSYPIQKTFPPKLAKVTNHSIHPANNNELSNKLERTLKKSSHRQGKSLPESTTGPSKSAPEPSKNGLPRPQEQVLARMTQKETKRSQVREPPSSQNQFRRESESSGVVNDIIKKLILEPTTPKWAGQVNSTHTDS